ncbi:MAG: glycosyltransferase [Crocinitomicaceae bacterium]|nr:glycosyltransferase [Crocinitomicaceae bacterium]MCF8410629.1 glycosyltransferase [Crocinitomicaceae bacterium]
MTEKRKIKVLRIINRFNIGGPTYNATFLTRFMSDDFETLLVGGLPEKDEADSLHILEEYGVEAIYLPEMKRKPSFFSDRRALKKIKKIIQEYQPDIVHTHAAKAGALGRKAAFDCRVPVVVHTFHGHVFHSYFGVLKTLLYKFIERRLASKSTGIITISEIQKKEIVEVHGISNPNKTTVIQLGFDLSKFNENLDEKRSSTRNTFNVKEDEVAIAIIGRLAPVKNHALFFEIVKLIHQKTQKKPVFFVVGDGELRTYIEEQIKDLNEIGVDIRFTSWIKDIATFNAGMDVICLTSKNEGTPVSLIESQAANVPVITTDVGGARDIIADNLTGFIVPSNNARIFADKLIELIDNEPLRIEMGMRGWPFVKDTFHYTRLVKDMEKYYIHLLSLSK